MRIFLSFLATAAAASSLVACGSGQPPPSTPGAAAPTQAATPVSLDKNAYPVFPNADEGADPTVSAELGGRGFTGEGWETNTDYDLIGDPRAVKGGAFRDAIPSFPGTLRVAGPEWNTTFNYMIASMVYEGLLAIHPTTLKYIPVLATHWQVSADRATYRFRINPNSRWADGEPVVAEDVVATWDFLVDKGLQDPSYQLILGKFERPVAESKYIVRVQSKVLNWQNFLSFSTMLVLPSHLLKNIDGAKYLEAYNFKMLPGTGAYKVDDADIEKGKGVSIRRRTDYWAEHVRRNVGLNNFDEIRETVVRDRGLTFEQFKKGDLDFYYVNISREWVEEMNFDRVKRGLVQKRKIFNDNPTGVSGMAFNTRKAPFSDLRVRKALTLLEDRDELIAKLFFNEYVPLNSYYAGGIYENPNNPKNKYDPQTALQLLAEAGWKDRDAQGRLVKGGQPLSLELLYSDQGAERYLTVYQQALGKIGIGLNLRLVTPETRFKLMMDRNFDMVSTAWAAGGPFPDPEPEYSSSLADIPNNNNVTGFKDARVDELLKTYNEEFDSSKRAGIIQEIDGILTNAYHYSLGWDAPFSRIAYWNKFGQPDGFLSRIGDYNDIPSMWWIDPKKDGELRRALGDNSATLPVGETEVRYWVEYGEREKAAAAKQ